MVKKRRILLGIAILGVVFWAIWHAREPVYKGKPLSYWLDGYYYSSGQYIHSVSMAEADDAIHHLGTNALPELLEYLMADESPASFRIRDWVWRSRFGTFAGKHGLAKDISEAQIKNQKAIRGFVALGTNASSAIPFFIKICEDNQDFRGSWAVQELDVFGPAAKDGVPALVRILTTLNTNNPANGKPSLAVLTTPSIISAGNWRSRVASRASDEVMREQACRSLGGIHSRPELAVPALVRCATTDPEIEVRIAAFQALAHFGLDARATTPALTEFIRTNTFNIRLNFSARDTLKKIDPSAALITTNDSELVR